MSYLKDSTHKLYNTNEGHGWFISNIHDGLFYSKYLAVRKGNFVEPWQDDQIHYHTISQEIFLILEGEITLSSW